MNSRLVSLLSCSMVCLVAGCDALVLLLPRTVTVRLVNNGDFSVDGELYYHDDESALDLLNSIDTLDNFIREFGTKVDFEVAAGETFSFTESCNDLEAIFIDDADLRVIAGFSPDDDTEVLRDGTDFSCGDTITYTFDHLELGINFAITTSVTPTSSLFP